MLKEVFIQGGGGKPLGRRGVWWTRWGREESVLKENVLFAGK